MNVEYETCPGCGERRRIEFDTDGHGRLVEISGQCTSCRRLARTRPSTRPQCLDCSAPAESPRHGRCKACKRLKRNATKREWRRVNEVEWRRQREVWEEGANPERLARYYIRMRDRARKYGPDNPPKCSKCGAPVPYVGRGTPRRECSSCRAPSSPLD